MKHLTLLSLIILLLTACQSHEHVVLVSSKDEAKQVPAHAARETSRRAAVALLDSLTDDQKKTALHDIKAPLKKDWHFIPRKREGLMLGDMTAEQKTNVHKLMQTALSDSGYLKATDIIWLEAVLYEMSNQNPMRDPGKYALQIFGDPTDEKAAWGWRLEGHHLSINLTYTAEGIGVTPLFFGTNPAVVPKGPLAGKRVLADAHNIALDLAKSMSDEQRKKMMLDKKPRDVITGPGREEMLKDPVGISVSELTSAIFPTDQYWVLMSLILCHFENLDTPHFEEAHKWIMKMHLKDYDFRFAWAGPIDSDEPFYYRIQSKDFVIEYSCQGKNHVHCVVHDLTDPLQEDLLKKHFEEHEH